MRGEHIAQRGARLINNVNTLGYIPMVADILNIPDINVAPMRIVFPEDWMEDRMHHSAQMSLTYGVLPRVTLRLSDLSNIPHRGTGVTLRIISQHLSHLWEPGGLSAPHLHY